MTRSCFLVASRVVVACQVVVPGLVALFLSTPVRAQTDGSNLQPRRAMGWLDAARDLNRELGLSFYRRRRRRVF